MIWFDAETCPKDGTEFVAYDRAVDKFDVCVWSEEMQQIEQVQEDGEYGPLSHQFGYHRGCIVAWQPLPPRPGSACPIVMPQ